MNIATANLCRPDIVMPHITTADLHHPDIVMAHISMANLCHPGIVMANIPPADLHCPDIVRPFFFRDLTENGKLSGTIPSLLLIRVGQSLLHFSFHQCWPCAPLSHIFKVFFLAGVSTEMP